MAQILRLTAFAEFDDPTSLVAAVRSVSHAGDGEQTWMLDRWLRGELFVARLTVKAQTLLDDGAIVDSQTIAHGVWLERDTLPLVERQVSEAAPRAFPELARHVRRAGAPVALEDLDALFVHVELAPDLRLAVLDPGDTPHRPPTAA